MTTEAKELSTAEIANEIADFVMKKEYGHNTLEAMWLAMQLVGGPIKAATTLSYCGVNFSTR